MNESSHSEHVYANRRVDDAQPYLHDLRLWILTGKCMSLVHPLNYCIAGTGCIYFLYFTRTETIAIVSRRRVRHALLPNRKMLSCEQSGGSVVMGRASVFLEYPLLHTADAREHQRDGPPARRCRSMALLLTSSPCFGHASGPCAYRQNCTRKWPSIGGLPLLYCYCVYVHPTHRNFTLGTYTRTKIQR